eukprot:scaffold2547_cov277-Chaetoceros_neogracile.AAC.6
MPSILGTFRRGNKARRRGNQKTRTRKLKGEQDDDEPNFKSMMMCLFIIVVGILWRNSRPWQGAGMIDFAEGTPT